jgi:hypothetical protein
LSTEISNANFLPKPTGGGKLIPDSSSADRADNDFDIQRTEVQVVVGGGVGACVCCICWVFFFSFLRDYADELRSGSLPGDRKEAKEKRRKIKKTKRKPPRADATASDDIACADAGADEVEPGLAGTQKAKDDDQLRAFADSKPVSEEAEPPSAWQELLGLTNSSSHSKQTERIRAAASSLDDVLNSSRAAPSRGVERGMHEKVSTPVIDVWHAACLQPAVQGKSAGAVCVSAAALSKDAADLLVEPVSSKLPKKSSTQTGQDVVVQTPQSKSPLSETPSKQPYPGKRNGESTSPLNESPAGVSTTTTESSTQPLVVEKKAKVLKSAARSDGAGAVVTDSGEAAGSKAVRKLSEDSDEQLCVEISSDSDAVEPKGEQTLSEDSPEQFHVESSSEDEDVKKWRNKWDDMQTDLSVLDDVAPVSTSPLARSSLGLGPTQ